MLGAIPATAQDFDHTIKVAAPQSAAMQAANAALDARDWGKALKLLGPLAEANPKDAHLLYDLGSAQDALDQSSAAEQSYRAAIMDDGGYLESRVALGLLLARSGRMEDARAELMAAAAITDGDKLLRARALRAMARIDEKARPSEARDELLAALSLSPETPEDTLLTAELAEGANGGKDAAEAAYRRLLAEQPNDPDATASLAHLLTGEKRYPEGEKLLTDGLAAHPDNEPMTIQLAALYVADGKTAQALPLVEGLHQKSPNEASVSRLLAELYVQVKDYAQAEALLARLSEQMPQDGGLVDLWAEALLQLHRFAEAERILDRIVATPGVFSGTDAWGTAAFDLAFAASEQNEPAKTLQLLENRAKVLPPSAAVLWLKAISEDKLHRIKLAAEAYQQFLVASNGANPNEEFEARHRLVALDHMK
jgi:tetratricopeptide (TPR) repeat protein